MLSDIFHNQVLIAGLIGWFLGQFLKVPFEYLMNRRMNWALWFSSGGMPSSHSSLMTSVTLSTGLNYGFGSAIFAVAFAISMVVVYDATGVRRQAGIHAQKINIIFEEFLRGEPIEIDKLKVVLGHTPLQVVGGVILGVFVALIIWGIW
ncbi:MAG: divergent PAP2 family protein [Calditrichales bacterium]|nr:MAG: divergent PAP2 family protein [Calditrichales bacterium]